MNKTLKMLHGVTEKPVNLTCACFFNIACKTIFYHSFIFIEWLHDKKIFSKS